jgi:hypothetical protein
VALAEEVVGSQTKQQRHEFVNSLADQLESISATADELLEAAKPSIISIDSAKTEPSVPELREDDLTPAEAVALNEFETPVEIQEIKAQTSEQEQEQEQEQEPVVAEQPSETSEGIIDTKLAEYYGVTQMSDAAVFVTLYPRAQEVQIAGDFNNWQPEQSPMEKVGESGVWQTKMNLAAGRYRYRLVVDGQWQQDPYNEQTEQNPFGGLNSVLEVK